MSRALRRNALLLIHGAILIVMALVMLGPLNCPPALCAHDAGSARLAPTVAPPPVELAMEPGRRRPTSTHWHRSPSPRLAGIW